MRLPRILVLIICYLAQGNAKHVEMIKSYRGKVEGELNTVCGAILATLKDALIPNSTTGESKVFYYKMKGDYHRYLAEFQTADGRKKSTEVLHSTVVARDDGMLSSAVGYDPQS